MEERTIKLNANSCSIPLKVVPGHFVTSHSHVNYYIDMTTFKTRLSEAEEVAEDLAGMYRSSTIVDTILCLEGTQVIGTLMGGELSRAGYVTMNLHSSIYIATPEYDSNNQMFFRENTQPMITGKNVIILLTSITTGITLRKAIECLNYYGGKLAGISAIFSRIDSMGDMKINSVFNASDLPDYESFSPSDCPLCKAGTKIDALVNSYGYSKL